MHFYPFNIKDWALHTAHLSLEEEGAYRRLLDMYYDTEQPIPEETQLVIRRLRLGSYVSEVEQVLSEFFDLEDDGYHNSRADIEISDYQNRVNCARKNGKKGGRPRKDKGVKTQSVSSANPATTKPKANQELEPVTKTSNQVIQVKSPKAQKVKFNPVTTATEQTNKTAWIEWIDYRASKGKKISEAAAKKQIKFLSGYPAIVQQQIVDKSITNDYQGLFEPAPIQGQFGHQQQPAPRKALSHD